LVDAFQIAFMPEGLATGIGSLPFVDPEAALELIFAELPEMPHWPQLPRRGEQEHFVHQFLQPLMDCGMLTSEGGRWILDASGENSAACLTEFYTTCLPAEAGDGECLRSYLPTPEAAAGLYAFLARARAGIHSCEALDWSLLLETHVQILSLDAYRFGASLIPYAAPLVRFVERGGVIAWGIVPTLDDPYNESVESLLQRLDSLWKDLFPMRTVREKVLDQSMLTPACGTGLLTEDRTRRIYRLTAGLSRKLRGGP
jgi:hypothetical protein